MNSISTLFKNRLLVITTIIPTVLAIIYFGLIASDIYISESRFVVRSPEKQSSSIFGTIFKGAGFSKSTDDSYTVQDYILSRDAIKALNDELKIKESFASSDIDIFSRFSGLDFDDSLEAFYRYYQKKVLVQVDSSSSITTLTVRAFSKDTAFDINQRLVDLAENLVNKLNERGRGDMIRFATEEVAQAQTNAKTAALALSKFRGEKGVIDPEKQSAIPLQQIGKLQDDLISMRSQIMQLEKLSKDNPQLPILRQRVVLLESEIVTETGRVAGGDRSLASKASEFQRLVLEKEFSEKMLASSMITLEQAKNEAQRKQLYLERIVQPYKPDKAMEPRRIQGVLTTLVLGLISWGILTMLIAGIKEHQD